MAQITNANFSNFPDAVVVGAWFKFRVTFDENINPGTFTESAFIGDIEIKAGSKTVITADTVFEFIGRFPLDLERGNISLQLEGIEDAASDTAAVAKVVNSTDIVVLESATFEVLTGNSARLLIDFFDNPLSGDLTFTVQAQPSGFNLVIGTEGHLSIPSIAESVVSTQKVDGNSFVDKAFKLRAENTAGHLDQFVVLRILSGLPKSTLS